MLCHNNLNPGNVRLGPHARLIVTGWEHANGLPPEWELSAALASWAVNPNGGINAAGARALLEGYRERAGSLPALTPDTFRGAAPGCRTTWRVRLAGLSTRQERTMSDTPTGACGICSLTCHPRKPTSASSTRPWHGRD